MTAFQPFFAQVALERLGLEPHRRRPRAVDGEGDARSAQCDRAGGIGAGLAVDRPLAGRVDQGEADDACRVARQRLAGPAGADAMRDRDRLSRRGAEAVRAAASTRAPSPPSRAAAGRSPGAAAATSSSAPIVRNARPCSTSSCATTRGGDHLGLLAVDARRRRSGRSGARSSRRRCRAPRGDGRTAAAWSSSRSGRRRRSRRGAGSPRRCAGRASCSWVSTRIERAGRRVPHLGLDRVDRRPGGSAPATARAERRSSPGTPRRARRSSRPRTSSVASSARDRAADMAGAVQLQVEAAARLAASVRARAASSGAKRSVTAPPQHWPSEGPSA